MAAEIVFLEDAVTVFIDDQTLNKQHKEGRTSLTRFDNVDHHRGGEGMDVNMAVRSMFLKLPKTMTLTLW